MRRLLGVLMVSFFAYTNISSRLMASGKGFVIVVDPKSYSEAKAELAAYAKAVEEVDGMKTYTLVDKWGVPDSIRAALEGMYKKGQIQGTVLIGDIPIAMIRDAQHLTSAFKMDQRMPKDKSSVPSDRFYDDFGLQFKFLSKTDSTHLYYYSLQPEGHQYIHCNIFSGRIRPTDAQGTSRYDKLRQFLTKAVAEKYAANRLDKVFFFTGQGSLDESKVAAMDEKQQYYEHFPWLKQQTSETIQYMDFSQQRYIKTDLMNALQAVDLDYAVLHHHGDYDTQYLSKACKEVPDSIDVDMRDLHLCDFKKYGFHPNARIVNFDACYNASFVFDDCIANAYIFAPGKTVACVGGTVNLLQDKWYDRMVGLLGQGCNIGQVNAFQEFLESHVVGDPTARFVKEKNVGKTSDAICYHLDQRYWAGKVSTSELLSLLQTSPYDQVRLQALTLLARLGGSDFVKGIEVASSDRYEMVQRFAMNYLRGNGHPSLAESLVRVWTSPVTSARVKTDARRALEYFEKDIMMKAWNKVWPSVEYVNKAEKADYFLAQINKYAGYWSKDIDQMLSDTVSDRDFRFTASCMRIYCPHFRIPDILSYVEGSHSDARRLPLIEAMGWYMYSEQSSAIARTMRKLADDASQSAEIRSEALKTYNRIMQCPVKR